VSLKKPRCSKRAEERVGCAAERGERAARQRGVFRRANSLDWSALKDASLKASFRARFKMCHATRVRRREHFVTVPYDSAASRPFAFATHVAPAILYAAALFYGGLIRMAELPEFGPVPSDKILHTLAFGGLALLLVRAAAFFWPQTSLGNRLLLGALGSSLLGALLEVCQAFVPYRSSDPFDWLADTLGASLAVGLLLAFLHFRLKRAHG
jgi:hypothetical protein